jgi:ribosomal protein S18 acetylase RimI-like enzyme
LNRLTSIRTRTTLQAGDIGFITYLHGKLYKEEYNYGIPFESYVAEGLVEFYNNYQTEKDVLWVCEDSGNIIGSLLLLHRSATIAQLRYFLLHPSYRGIGLGKKLMQSLVDQLITKNYKYCYLWTTNEQEAAASLYKKFGFILTEEKTSTTYGKNVVEQRYELIVTAAQPIN